MKAQRVPPEHGAAPRKEALTGAWTDLKGRLRETYSALSDDQLERAKGHREQMVGLLQGASGVSREEAERLLREAAEKARYAL